MGFTQNHIFTQSWNLARETPRNSGGTAPQTWLVGGLEHEFYDFLLNIVISYRYVKLPEGKPPFSYGFPMVFPFSHRFSYGFPMVSDG